METVYLIIDIFVAVFLLVIGGLVLARDSQSKLNRIFFMFIISLSAWILSNYFSNSQSISSSWALLANHLVLFSSSLAIYFFLWFVMLTVPLSKIVKYEKWILSIGFFISFLSLTGLVIEGIQKQNSVYALTFGPLAVLYFINLIFAAVLSVGLLIIGLRTAQGIEYARIKTILISLIATVCLALISNVLIPLTTGSFELTNIGPIFTLFLAVGLSYSIIKHRLFNIRLIIARSVAYLLSLGLIALILTVLAIVAARLFLNEPLSLQTEIAFAIFGALAALVFQPVKKFFDRLSNNIFYRDSYSAQQLINKINSTIVTNSDISTILLNTERYIEKFLKIEYVHFYLKSNSSNDFEMVGSDKKNYSSARVERLLKMLVDSAQKTHSMNQTSQVSNISEPMKSLKLECAIQMITNGELVGFVFIGTRKSGNALLDKDIQLLEIIADELAIAVQNSMQLEEISQFNLTLQKKIDIATSQLQKSNEKLKALDSAKDEFISMASHQLRTPLTSVKGYISMILEGDAGEINDLQKKFLNQAFISSQRMVYLISDLLNVSRLKTGKFVIENRETYLPDTVEDELRQLDETIKARGLSIDYKKPKKFPTVMLDEDKVRQVIMNFADNAIYYTPSGGKIYIELKATDEVVKYTVKDTGIGVPKHEQHHLFTKFYRAGNARKARPDGTGLGLFMAKKVITAQGGSIIFSSEQGKGSTFGFSLPRKKVEKTT